MQPLHYLVILLCLSLAFSPPVTSQPAFRSADGESERLGQSYERFIRTAMERWSLPGLIIVVVKDDKVLYMKGHGTRVVGEHSSVDQRTLVQIASNSKIFTATAIAMLVSDGRLSWDDPVKKHIPEFAIQDDWIASHLTVRDLMAHRGGLPAEAIGGMRNSTFHLEDLLKELRNRRADGFRERQIYSQPGLAIAGEVVSRVSGMSWERFIRERIFSPLEMVDSYTSNADLAERFGETTAERNIFLPARRTDGDIHRGNWSEIGASSLYAPAAGIISTGSDMSKWIAFQLSGGEAKSGRLLSKDALEETRVPLIPLDSLRQMHTNPIGDLATGTLGWRLVSYGGLRIYLHPGAGMSSLVALVPKEQLGVAIFTNAYFSLPSDITESIFYTHALAMQTIDQVLGLNEKDWIAAYEDALSRISASGR